MENKIDLGDTKLNDILYKVLKDIGRLIEEINSNDYDDDENKGENKHGSKKNNRIK